MTDTTMAATIYQILLLFLRFRFAFLLALSTRYKKEEYSNNQCRISKHIDINTSKPVFSRHTPTQQERVIITATTTTGERAPITVIPDLFPAPWSRTLRSAWVSTNGVIPHHTLAHAPIGSSILSSAPNLYLWKTEIRSDSVIHRYITAYLRNCTIA